MLRCRRASLPLCILAALPAAAAAQRLIAPARTRMDDVLDVRVVGLRPSQRVTLRATMRDSAQRTWRAEARFAANRSGEVVPARDPSLGGSYTGVDPMGLVTSMDLPGRAGSSIYVAPGLMDLSVTFAVIAGGRVLDSATVVRHFVMHAVRPEAVREPGGLTGVAFYPTGPAAAPGVLVLGGSEGGNSAADVAAQLTARGYATLSLPYFGADSLPRELDEIPLEYFMRAITYLAHRPEVDSTRIAIIGTSKGAEAALLVAARDPRVRAVVAYAPSSVAWSCICSTPAHSSWSFGGNPVPSIPPGRDPGVAIAAGQAQRPVVHYRYRMRDPEVVAKAAIPVERINGPIMLVVGGADELWPSGEMARQIRERRAGAAHRAGDTTFIYPRAGHRIGKSYLPAGSTRVAGGRLETGGTPRANAAAQADAWPQVLRFLATAFRR
jgi:dienelactone hydrolase